MEGETFGRRPPKSAPLGYVPALDGLRAIAALGVILLHSLNSFTNVRPQATVQGGFYGVDIFFTLSGFLITTLLVEEFQRRGTIDLRAFWVRRVLRLMPALLLVIAMTILFGALVDAGRLPFGQGLNDRQGTYNGSLLLPFWQGIPVTVLPISNWLWVIGHAYFVPTSFAWSLAIEDQFYFLWPFALLLLLACRRFTLRSAAFLVLGVAVTATLWRNWILATRVSWDPNGSTWDATYRRTDARADEILIGCALALLLASGLIPTSILRRRLLGALAWICLVGILALYLLGRSTELITHQIGLTLVAVLTAVLISHLVTHRSGRLSAVLAWPPLIGIGQVSYGLYMWHFVWLSYTPAAGYERLPLAIVLTAASALASYYVIEQPALRLKRRFERAGHPHSVKGTVHGGESRTSRRNLLPVLGAASLAVATGAVYFMSIRIYPKDVIASALNTTPEPTPQPTSVPSHAQSVKSVLDPTQVTTFTQSPRPIGQPRSTRAPRARRMRQETALPGHQARSSTTEMSVPGIE